MKLSSAFSIVVFGRKDWQRDGKTVDEDGYATHLIAESGPVPYPEGNYPSEDR